jgi:hypothetical protein
MGPRRWRVLAGAGAVLSLASCGSSSSSTSSGGTATTTAAPAARATDSCSVVTPAQAGAALGQPVKPPVRGSATVEGGVACVFYGPDAPAGASADVPVRDSVRAVLVTGPDARRFFEDYRAKVAAQPVAGLGDEAYYDGYASLSVLKGDAYLRVAVIGVPDVLGAEKKLAAGALPRM